MKLPPSPVSTVDGAPASSYFFAMRSRLALHKDRVLIRLPKALAVFATLLLAVLAFSASAGTAAAHGNHSHSLSISSSGPWISPPDREGAAESDLPSAQELTTATVWDNSHTSHDHSGTSDCCCGGIMCHAGMAFAVGMIPSPILVGARVLAEPSSGHPQRSASGLERPPRSPSIA